MRHRAWSHLAAFLLSFSLCLAAEPRAVAEAAVAAWQTKDANRLLALAHPELIERARTARIILFHLESDPAAAARLKTASASEVIAQLCAALRKIVPDNKPLVFVARYVGTEFRDDLAIVTIAVGWQHPEGKPAIRPAPTEFVPKKAGDDWKFLWSRAVNLHFDFDWDPIAPPRRRLPIGK